MSAKSWQQEFYPTPAHSCSAEDAVKHSLLKWTGLRDENLKRHGVRLTNGGRIMTVESDDLKTRIDYGIIIDSRSCALCIHYTGLYISDCINCPVYRVRENTKCDSKTSDELDKNVESPWFIFKQRGDPEPMIKVLEDSVQLELRQRSIFV